MRILITGGAGFIGSHLCDKYTEEGHTVLCLDNFMSGDIANVKHLLDYRNFQLIKGDIRNYELLETVMRDVEAVFHLAAVIHVTQSYVEPQLTYDVNVRGTQNILEWARIYDVKRIIYASTSEVYGMAQYVPMDEKHPLNAPHFYGASKIAADRLCYAYIKTYGMDVVIMRPFNVFGPRQSDKGYGGAIAIFARRLLSGDPPIVNGDGKQTRDYTYIEDVVRAYDAVLHHKEPIDEPINFGSGKEVSIIELAETLIKLFGRKGMKPLYASPRVGEVNRLVADANKANELLGWFPAVGLREGLAKFADWHKNKE